MRCLSDMEIVSQHRCDTKFTIGKHKSVSFRQKTETLGKNALKTGGSIRHDCMTIAYIVILQHEH